jgi:hypothetical protein
MSILNPDVTKEENKTGTITLVNQKQPQSQIRSLRVLFNNREQGQCLGEATYHEIRFHTHPKDKSKALSGSPSCGDLGSFALSVIEALQNGQPAPQVSLVLSEFHIAAIYMADDFKTKLPMVQDYDELMNVCQRGLNSSYLALDKLSGKTGLWGLEGTARAIFKHVGMVVEFAPWSVREDNEIVLLKAMQLGTPPTLRCNAKPFDYRDWFAGIPSAPDRGSLPPLPPGFRHNWVPDKPIQSLVRDDGLWEGDFLTKKSPSFKSRKRPRRSIKKKTVKRRKVKRR